MRTIRASCQVWPPHTAALTLDREVVLRAIDGVAARAPGGGARLAEGLELVEAEILGKSGGESSPDGDRARVVVLLTDGYPTPAMPSGGRREEAAAFRVADRLGASGIRLDVYFIGTEALQEPEVGESLASRTGGRFTAVKDATKLVSVLESVRTDAPVPPAP